MRQESPISWVDFRTDGKLGNDISCPKSRGIGPLTIFLILPSAGFDGENGDTFDKL
jgi:hypothetical protein